MLDAIIIGSGPAGLSAAITAAENGLKVKVIDEFIKPGGRLLGQLHQEPDGKWWNGIHEAQTLLEKATSHGVQFESGVSVHQLNKEENNWVVYTNRSTLSAERVLIATGAAEAASPLPGWTLPGVMSIGAAQVMTNVHRVRVGKKGIIIGVNVLATAIARELQLAGITINGIVLPQINTISKDGGHPQKVFESLLHVSHLAPSPLIRFGGKWMKSPFLKQLGVQFFPKKGLKMWDIPIHLRKAATHIIGTDRVEAVRLVDVTPLGEPIPGTEQVVEADFVCIAGGLYPLAELAAVAGCPFYYIPELGGHIPLHNENMETPLNGLFVAGNITGIESAKVALAQGTVAGYSMVYQFDPSKSGLAKKIKEAVENVNNVRDHALIQFHPEIKKGRERMKTLWRESLKLGETF